MAVLKLLAILALCFLEHCYGAGCPVGWTEHGESCYIFFHERYTFFEAKVTCDLARGNMVEVSSEEENNFITSMALQHGDDETWIGLEDFVVEGNFVWTTSNEPTGYTNWDQNEPDDFQSAEDCVFLRASTGHWADNDCEDKLNFICEQPMEIQEAIGK